MTLHKLFNTGECLTLILPARFVRRLGWAKGDYVSVELDGRKVVVTNALEKAAKPRVIDRGIRRRK